jgi:hypothetical protein
LELIIGEHTQMAKLTFVARALLLQCLIVTALGVATNSTLRPLKYGVRPFTDEEFALRFERWNNLVSLPETTTSCSHDMRSQMPECHQSGTMWCWATGIAAVTEYYNSADRSKYPHCNGLECQIVSWCPKPPACSAAKMTCCPYSSHVQDCGDLGAEPAMIVTAANHFIQRSHALYGGPLPQNVLDQTLQAGHPVLMIVGPGRTEMHVVQVRGCGGGMYYFWDPEWQPGTSIYPPGSDKRTYKQLLSYTYPNGYTLNWLDSLWHSGSQTDNSITTATK